MADDMCPCSANIIDKYAQLELTGKRLTVGWISQTEILRESGCLSLTLASNIASILYEHRD